MKQTLLLLLLLSTCGMAHAIVPDNPYTVSFTCTGGFGPFPFTFPISDPTSMSVTMNGTLLPSVDYTIIPTNNNYNNGGSVTLVPSLPCTAGWPLVLERDTNKTQSTKFYDNMPIPMSTFERGLDKLTEITQEIWGETLHSVTLQSVGVNVGVPASGGNVVLNFANCSVTAVQSGSTPDTQSVFTIGCAGSGGGGGGNIAHTINFLNGDNTGNAISSGIPITTFGLYAPNYTGGDVFAQAVAANNSSDCPAGGCTVLLPNNSSTVSTPAIFNKAGACPILKGSGPGTILTFATPPTVGMQFSCAAPSQYGWGPRDFVLLGPGTVWKPNTSFPLNTYVQMGNYNDHSCNIYKVTTVGTSDPTTEPSWHTSCPNQGDTCTDGSEVLTNFGSSIGVLWSGSSPNNESHTGTMSGMNIRGFGCSEAIGSNAWGVAHTGSNGLQTFVDTNSSNSGEMWTFGPGTIFGGNDGRFTGQGFFVGVESANIQVFGSSFDDLQDWYEHGGGADLYGVHHEWYALKSDDHTMSQTVVLQGSLNHHGGSYLRSGHWYFDNIVDQQVDGNTVFDGGVSFFASTAPVWNANTAYDAHYVIAPTFALDPGNFSYENVAGDCTSDPTTQPDWTTCQTDACTVADNTCTWKGHTTGNANGMEYSGTPSGTRGTGRTAFKIEGGTMDATGVYMVGGVANLYDPDAGSITQNYRGGRTKVWIESARLTAPPNGSGGATEYIQSPPNQALTLSLVTGAGGVQKQNCLQFMDQSGGTPLGTFLQCVNTAGDMDWFGGYPGFVPRGALFANGGAVFHVPDNTQTFGINFPNGNGYVGVFANGGFALKGLLTLSTLAGGGLQSLGVNNSGQVVVTGAPNGTVQAATLGTIGVFPVSGSNQIIGAAPAGTLKVDSTGANLLTSNGADVSNILTIDAGLTAEQIRGFCLSDRGTCKWKVEVISGNFHIYDAASISRIAIWPADQFYNVPTGAVHHFQINGSDIVTIDATGLHVTVSGAPTQYLVYETTLTTTAASSDNVTVNGASATSVCSLTPTNSAAVTGGAYVSSKTTNQITVTHNVTASMNYDILCTPS